jgi:hypothetical protein
MMDLCRFHVAFKMSAGENWIYARTALIYRLFIIICVAKNTRSPGNKKIKKGECFSSRAKVILASEYMKNIGIAIVVYCHNVSAENIFDKLSN